METRFTVVATDDWTSATRRQAAFVTKDDMSVLHQLGQVGVVVKRRPVAVVLVGLRRLSQTRHGGDGFVEGMGPLLLRRIMRVAADLLADAFEVVLDVLWRGERAFLPLVFAPDDGGSERVAHHASLTEPVALRGILLVHPGSQAAKVEGVFAGVATKQITFILTNGAIVGILRNVAILSMSAQGTLYISLFPPRSSKEI